MTAYHRMKGPGDFDPPEHDDRRDEYIGEHADGIVQTMMTDAQKIEAVIEDHYPNSDHIARFLAAFENAAGDNPNTLAAIGEQLWREMRPSVIDMLIPEAEAQAGADWDRFEEDRP